jgi:mannose-6-phosphate isomerase-like protein (cupin superfamily)
MKRKVMRNWFISLFILGVILGWLIPMNFWDFTREAVRNPLQAGFYDIPKRIGQLDQQNEYVKYMVLGETQTARIQLLRLDEKIPMHVHNSENHFLYIYKGKAMVTIKDTVSEIGPGQMAIFPAGYKHSVERVGDAPVEAILFASPVEPNDTIYLDSGE